MVHYKKIWCYIFLACVWCVSWCSSCVFLIKNKFQSAGAPLWLCSLWIGVLESLSPPEIPHLLDRRWYTKKRQWRKRKRNTRRATIYPQSDNQQPHRRLTSTSTPTHHSRRFPIPIVILGIPKSPHQHVQLILLHLKQLVVKVWMHTEPFLTPHPADLAQPNMTRLPIVMPQYPTLEDHRSFQNLIWVAQWLVGQCSMPIHTLLYVRRLLHSKAMYHQLQYPHPVTRPMPMKGIDNRGTCLNIIFSTIVILSNQPSYVLLQFFASDFL